MDYHLRPDDVTWQSSKTIIDLLFCVSIFLESESQIETEKKFLKKLKEENFGETKLGKIRKYCWNLTEYPETSIAARVGWIHLIFFNLFFKQINVSSTPSLRWEWWSFPRWSSSSPPCRSWLTTSTCCPTPTWLVSGRSTDGRRSVVCKYLVLYKDETAIIS